MGWAIFYDAEKSKEEVEMKSLLRLFAVVGMLLCQTHSVMAACNCHDLPYSDMDDVDHNPPASNKIKYVRAGRLIDPKKGLCFKTN